MIVRGFVFSGVNRGGRLIEHYYDRLVGLVGFKPFKGTLDVKLDHEIDFTKYSNKQIDRIMTDGTRIVDALLMPVNIIIDKEGTTVKYPCWALHQEKGLYNNKLYGNDVIEIIAKERLKDALGIEDRQFLKIEIFELPKSEKSPGILTHFKTEFIKSRQGRVSKR